MSARWYENSSVRWNHKISCIVKYVVYKHKHDL